MKKIITTMITIIIIISVLTGCGNLTTNNELSAPGENTESILKFTFIPISVNTKGIRADARHFYKDPVTDIVYIQFKGAYSEGGLTYLPDPDTGLPLKYERFLELYKDYIPQMETCGGKIDDNDTF